jgi:hypothetical protein
MIECQEAERRSPCKDLSNDDGGSGTWGRRNGADAVDLVMRARALIFEAKHKQVTEKAVYGAVCANVT